MKYFFTIILLLFFYTSSYTQTNSVLLKNQGGTIISQHSSVQEAYSAIPATITQAYVIEIQTAYNGANELFPINFTARTGGSNSNTITLRPATGNFGEIITGSSSTGILVLNDADFIVIDGRPGGTGDSIGLKIENTITTGSNACTITLSNGSSNNVIRYVHVVNFTQNSAGPRAIEFSGASGNGNSDNLINNCKIEGGRSGIGFEGSSTTPLNNNITIRRCEIFNFGYAGIWLLSYSSNINIDSCVIYQTAGVNNTLNTGINIGSSVSGTINIRKNKIYDIQSTSTSTSNAIRGIWFQTSAASGSTYNIQNNFISLTLNNNSAQTIAGIDLGTGTNSYTANVNFNSVRIGGTHTGGTSGVVSAGIRSAAPNATLNSKNNICLNNRTGGTTGITHAGFALTNTSITKDINYNSYYADGTNGYHAYWGTTGYNVLADYKTAAAPDEQNTVFYNVMFVSNTDLHLTGNSLGNINLAGTPITGITTDIDNETRNAVLPYKGADEGSIPLSVITGTTIAETYKLSQNYPNPFNPSTIISFSIPRDNDVKVDIYDVRGSLVATLTEGFTKAGSYELQFDGSNLSSGVYFYKMISGSFSETKKMILMK